MKNNITYKQMMVALEASFWHWVANCNEAGKPETPLTLFWFDKNCQTDACALCELFDDYGCEKCPLDDGVCCKEWNIARNSCDEDGLTFHMLLEIEGRIKKELKRRQGLTGIYYRVKWWLYE